MIDDIRIRLQLAHKPIDEQELLPDGTKRPPRRMKLYGAWNNTVRARSVRDGQYLVIEGSFNGFLQGNNVIGSMNLQALVSEVVSRVLTHFGITPTRTEQEAIDDGRIKLERLDVVGYLKVGHLGGPPVVIKGLEVGLAGSREKRMMFPRETLVYHSHSKYWSLMAYDKEQQLRTKHPDTWNALDPMVKEVAKKYLRLELRQFGRELQRLGWLEVKDVTLPGMKGQFAKRLKRLLGDLRKPYPRLPLPSNVAKPSATYMRAMLLSHGHDFISGLPERSQRREWANLSNEYGITRRNVRHLASGTRRTLARLGEMPAFPIRHGAPRTLREAGLVAFT